MRLSKVIQNFVEKAKESDGYWVERTKLDFSLGLEKQRRVARMSYADIARKIGSSAAYVTKVFRGDANMTIESMVKLARATGGQLHIQIVDEQASTRRWDQFSRKPQTHSTKNSATIYNFQNIIPTKHVWPSNQAAA